MAEETVPRAAFDALVQQIAALQATIERLTAIIEEKNQIIQNQNRARFGQSSEKRTYVTGWAAEHVRDQRRWDNGKDG